MAVALVTAAMAVALPSAANADVGMKIIERCGHGQSLSGFTVAQYQRALHEMETEVIEYSDCVERIQQAELAAAGHKGGSSGSKGAVGGSGSGGTGGATSAPVEPTPTEQRILEQTRDEPLRAIYLGGGSGDSGSVQPGVVHPNLASATSNLPTPVLVVIALVLAGLLLLLGWEIKERSGRLREG